jgi:hypothetical protein
MNVKNADTVMRQSVERRCGMAEYGPPLTAEEAKRALKGYTERAGKATTALKAMLGRTEHDARVEALIAQVAGLCAHVRAMADRYGPSDADIAQTFKATVSPRGAFPTPAEPEDPKVAGLKDRFSEFVTYLGQADRCGRPLTREGDDYHRLWLRMVNDSVELFHALDRVSPH